MAVSSYPIGSKLENFITQAIEEDLAAERYPQGVCTRFPPEPNGYLHLGHAKAICMNFGIAKQYGGKCHLRFDDTNPMTEEESFVESIQSDIRWLGFQWDGQVRYASDYFEAFYQAAIRLIEQGKAYVDHLPLDEVKEYRGTLTSSGRESPYRNRSVEENLFLFQNMKEGKYREGACCLRAKIDMSSSVIVLRDPVLYRIRYCSHYRTKEDWCIYPMYDFAHPLSDAIEGISHSICTLEFQDNRRLYDWLLAQLAFPNPPKQYEFARLQLEGVSLSKRILKQFVDQGVVTGWDDPRMPTLSGLRSLGYSAEAIRLFCHRIGLSKQESCIERQVLENALRDTLNPSVPRIMAVLDPVEVILTNCTETVWIEAPVHPEEKQSGCRKLPLTPSIVIDRRDFRCEANKQYKRLVLGKEVRLRHACVVRATGVDRDQEGRLLRIYASCDWDTMGIHPPDGRKVKGVIHWVSKEYALSIRIYFFSPYLAEQSSESQTPSHTCCVQEALAEPSLRNHIVGTQLQLEREGYFLLAKKEAGTEQARVDMYCITPLKQATSAVVDR